MPPAARVGDATSHPTPPALGPGPGSSTVLIGKRPAWRATSDTHACVVPNPNGSPHGSGVVQKGSATVKINGLPAARLGDIVVELAGPPNAITAGEPTVIIGG